MIKCPLVKTHLNKCHKYNCGVSILFLSICCVVCVCVWGGGGGAAFAGTCERSLDRGVTCKASNPDPTQNKILLFL